MSYSIGKSHFPVLIININRGLWEQICKIEKLLKMVEVILDLDTYSGLCYSGSPYAGEIEMSCLDHDWEMCSQWMPLSLQ